MCMMIASTICHLQGDCRHMLLWIPNRFRHFPKIEILLQFTLALIRSVHLARVLISSSYFMNQVRIADLIFEAIVLFLCSLFKSCLIGSYFHRSYLTTAMLEGFPVSGDLMLLIFSAFHSDSSTASTVLYFHYFA